GPELPIEGVRVMDVAGDIHRALATEIGSRSRCVPVTVFIPVEKLKSDTTIKQPAQGVAVRFQSSCQRLQRQRTIAQGVKYAQGYRGEHRLRPAERLEEVDDD